MWNDKRKKYIKSIEHRLISSRSIYLVKVQYIWITDWDFNRGNPNERTNTCRAEFCECWFPERDLLDLKGHRLWSLANPPESSNTFGNLSTLLLVLLTGGSWSSNVLCHHQSTYSPSKASSSPTNWIWWGPNPCRQWWRWRFLYSEHLITKSSAAGHIWGKVVKLASLSWRHYCC